MSATPPPYAADPGAEPGSAAYCYRHSDRATGLRCQRCGRSACHECLQDAPVGFHCVDCVRAGAQPVAGGQARSFVAHYRTVGVATAGLIAVNVLLYVVTVIQSGSISGNARSELFYQLAMWPPAVEYGEFWRVLTATFLHFGLMHLGVNMLSLWMIGRDLELVFGKLRFLAVYLLAGIGGSLAVYFFDDPNVVLAGASGSVFGLLGALAVVLVSTKQSLSGLVAVLALNVVISFTPGISLIAHLGGLVTGIVVGFALMPRSRASRR